MPLKVVEATLDDAPLFKEVEAAAFKDAGSSTALFPGPFPKDTGADHRIESLRKQKSEDPCCRWAKVIDTDLDVAIAFGKWYMWGTPRTEPMPPVVWGPGSNLEACDVFFGGMRKEWEARMQGKPHSYLKILVTSPQHQRRGAGGMLLEWGNAEADRLRIPGYVEASAAGKPLYEKHGYKEIKRLVVDLSAWGGPTDETTTIMYREPKA